MTNEDLLYHYFSNTLNEAQMLEFNRRLEVDTEFKAEFEFENNLKRAIKHETNSNLKAKLKDFEKDIKKQETLKRKSVFNWKIAASVVLFLGAGWFGYNSFFGIDYDQLYTANFQEYPNTEFAITRSDSLDSPERKAFVAYEAEDYENAVKNFESILSDNQKPYHKFYKAQAYLKLEDLEKAKWLFKTIIANNENFAGESQWYLALIALKQKNKIEAKESLTNLIENYDYNKAKAEHLLKELN